MITPQPSASHFCLYLNRRNLFESIHEFNQLSAIFLNTVIHLQAGHKFILFLHINPGMYIYVHSYLLWLVVQQPVLSNEAGEQSGRCCGENGICSHEVLLDGHSCSAGNSKLSKKVETCRSRYAFYLTSTKILYLLSSYLDVFFCFSYMPVF